MKTLRVYLLIFYVLFAPYVSSAQTTSQIMPKSKYTLKRIETGDKVLKDSLTYKDNILYFLVSDDNANFSLKSVDAADYLNELVKINAEKISPLAIDDNGRFFFSKIINGNVFINYYNIYTKVVWSYRIDSLDSFYQENLFKPLLLNDSIILFQISNGNIIIFDIISNNVEIINVNQNLNMKPVFYDNSLIVGDYNNILRIKLSHIYSKNDTDDIPIGGIIPPDPNMNQEINDISVVQDFRLTIGFSKIEEICLSSNDIQQIKNAISSIGFPEIDISIMCSEKEEICLSVIESICRSMVQKNTDPSDLYVPK